jgi:uncharacterized protein (TIGR03083 family)
MAAAGRDTRAACARQWTTIADAVRALPEEAFTLPTRLPGWAVAELVSHLARCAASLPSRLAEPASGRAELDLPAYLLAAGSAAALVERRERDAAAAAAPMQLKEAVRDGVESLTAALNGLDPARPIRTRFGLLRAGEFVATRCVEGVVHALDLRAALSQPAGDLALRQPAGNPALDLVLDAQAVKVTAKGLLAALAIKAPGRSVEVRVPSVAAVQCVAGPRHTRGTPPGVVETDPTTWIELATGRLRWGDARDDGRLRASGERSDLSGLLPLL